MARRRKKRFREMKMYASRVEAGDYDKFEQVIKKNRKTLQEVTNMFVREIISGSICLSGSRLRGE